MRDKNVRARLRACANMDVHNGIALAKGHIQTKDVNEKECFKMSRDRY